MRVQFERYVLSRPNLKSRTGARLELRGSLQLAACMEAPEDQRKLQGQGPTDILNRASSSGTGPGETCGGAEGRAGTGQSVLLEGRTPVHPALTMFGASRPGGVGVVVIHSTLEPRFPNDTLRTA